MKRRDFFAASAAAGLGLSTMTRTRGAQAPRDRQLLELRVYRFTSAAKQQAFDAFLEKAFVPALNRAGVRPVGAFTMRKDDNPKLKMDADSTDLYVLLPHTDSRSFITLTNTLAEDKTLAQAGKAILEAPKSDPAYERYESTIMLAFKHMPRVDVPTDAKSRILQLRTYESHNSERALKKIEMFNKGGEIEIFRRSGMAPVFFGQSLAGSKLPNLTYMLSFKDQEALDKGWAAFLKDPGWLKLRDNEAYKDTVSNITNLILRPAAGSQI